jgi:glycosyltransferase involved in cell wall biosynthesis
VSTIRRLHRPLCYRRTWLSDCGWPVLALGRISWEKGLDRLIAALPQAPTAKVVIAGDDDGGHAAFLAAGPSMRWLGALPSSLAMSRGRQEAVRRTRLFAMTSLSENFGLAAFEAMRRGVPVATPDVGMSEVVRGLAPASSSTAHRRAFRWPWANC